MANHTTGAQRYNARMQKVWDKAMNAKRKILTQQEFTGEDFAEAERIAAHLGYTQTAYTSSSDMIGLFCLPDHAKHRRGCVVKTAEFGFLFVQDVEDIGSPNYENGTRLALAGRRPG